MNGSFPLTTVYINTQSRTVYDSIYDSWKTGTMQMAKPMNSTPTLNCGKITILPTNILKYYTINNPVQISSMTWS